MSAQGLVIGPELFLMSESYAGRIGDAWAHGENPRPALWVHLDPLSHLRTRTDQRHVAAHHVPELGQLIRLQRRRNRPMPVTRAALPGSKLPRSAPGRTVIVRNFNSTKSRPRRPTRILAEKNWETTCECYCTSSREVERTQDHNANCRDSRVKSALQRGTSPEKLPGGLRERFLICNGSQNRDSSFRYYGSVKALGKAESIVTHFCPPL